MVRGQVRAPPACCRVPQHSEQRTVRLRRTPHRRYSMAVPKPGQWQGIRRVQAMPHLSAYMPTCIAVCRHTYYSGAHTSTTVTVLTRVFEHMVASARKYNVQLLPHVAVF